MRRNGKTEGQDSSQRAIELQRSQAWGEGLLPRASGRFLCLRCFRQAWAARRWLSSQEKPRLPCHGSFHLLGTYSVPGPVKGLRHGVSLTPRRWHLDCTHFTGKQPSYWVIQRSSEFRIQFWLMNPANLPTPPPASLSKSFPHRPTGHTLEQSIGSLKTSREDTGLGKQDRQYALGCGFGSLTGLETGALGRQGISRKPVTLGGAFLASSQGEHRTVLGPGHNPEVWKEQLQRQGA